MEIWGQRSAPGQLGESGGQAVPQASAVLEEDTGISMPLKTPIPLPCCPPPADPSRAQD